MVEVAADGTVTERWTGLTLVTALAAGPDGALYALEMATGIDPADQGSIAAGTGRVVRLVDDGAVEEVVTGLALPVSMEFGPDGALYLAGPAFGADEGQGSILRIDVSGRRPIVVPTDLEGAPAC